MTSPNRNGPHKAPRPDPMPLGERSQHTSFVTKSTGHWPGLEVPLTILCPPRRFKLKNYQLVLALVFAIEEINRNVRLLPKVSLGFDLYNVLFNDWNTLESTFLWLSGTEQKIPNYTCRRESKSVAALTGISWATSAQIGTLLKLYKFPQVRARGKGP